MNTYYKIAHAQLDPPKTWFQKAERDWSHHHPTHQQRIDLPQTQEYRPHRHEPTLITTHLKWRKYKASHCGSTLQNINRKVKIFIFRFLKSIFNMSHFKDLISCINHTDIIKQHLGIIGIRKILSVSDNPPIQDVIDVGLIPKMIALVRQT